MPASPQGYRRPNFKELATDQARYQRWLLKNECKAFYTPVFAEDMRQGAQYLLQVGKMAPLNWVLGMRSHIGLAPVLCRTGALYSQGVASNGSLLTIFLG